MTEPTPETSTGTGAPQSSTSPSSGGGQQTQTGTAESFDRTYVENLRKEAGDYRQANKNLAQELEALKAGQMSDTERQINEAKKSARQEAASDFGKRLAGAEFRAAAKEAGVDVKDVLEWVDLTKFVGESGDVDSKAVEAAVSRFAAMKQPSGTSFDGGARTTAPKPKNMNDFIRQQAGLTQ